MERLPDLRNRLENLRKSGKIPYWRFTFAEFLAERVGEYLAVNRTTEAAQTLSRLEKWILENEKTLKENSNIQLSEIEPWKADILKQVVDQVRLTLDTKRHLIPAPERETFLRRLDKTFQMIQSFLLKEAYDELTGVRSDLISRLYRSYRARGAFVPGDNLFHQQNPGTATGLYNTQHTLEMTLSLVGERDPIWVEDFLELYNNLMKITDRLTPAEKKRL